MILVDIMMMTTFARCMDTRKRLSSHDSEVIIVVMLTMMLMLMVMMSILMLTMVMMLMLMVMVMVMLVISDCVSFSTFEGDWSDGQEPETDRNSAPEHQVTVNMTP